MIPAHNSGPYIAPALDSILAQKHRPIEILVVDDGSTDSTVQTVREYAPDIRVIEQEQRGHSAARVRPWRGEALVRHVSSHERRTARFRWGRHNSRPLEQRRSSGGKTWNSAFPFHAMPRKAVHVACAA